MKSSKRQDVLLQVLVDAPVDQVPDHEEIDASPSLELKESWLRQGGHSNPNRGQSPG
jgi:hypothetical protein